MNPNGKLKDAFNVFEDKLAKANPHPEQNKILAELSEIIDLTTGKLHEEQDYGYIVNIQMKALQELNKYKSMPTWMIPRDRIRELEEEVNWFADILAQAIYFTDPMLRDISEVSPDNDRFYDRQLKIAEQVKEFSKKVADWENKLRQVYTEFSKNNLPKGVKKMSKQRQRDYKLINARLARLQGKINYDRENSERWVK